MFREATVDDLTALLDLERAANLAGLGHVFPPERYPFPDDDVLARWALVLDEPGVDVLVRDAPDGGIDLFAAYDDRSLRHLAVHPGLWGSGLATTAIETVLRSMDERGTTIAELWCLEENTRARRLYEYLGWRARVFSSRHHSSAIETVLRSMDERGTTIAELWCLEENTRARRLYEYLGWRAERDRRPAPWPPHPTEMRYTRLIPQSDR